jgi:hypothetical protein
MSQTSTHNDSLQVSYLVLRKFIGMLGIALPFVLAAGAAVLSQLEVQNSISDYYYTVMRDVFVGILCAIAVFMLSYRGYERKDNIAGNIACLAALGVAFFPVAPEINPSALQDKLGIVHYISASVFFLTLAYFSLALFTKSDPAVPPTVYKIRRNRVYKICGFIILGALAGIVGLKFLSGSTSVPLKQLDPVFWLEAVAVVAFGVSWIIKGEAFLEDPVP